jgi:hypothetical protein
MNTIDLCAIVPFFITLGSVFEEKQALRNEDNMLLLRPGEKQDKGASLAMLRVIRLVRVFRYKSHKHRETPTSVTIKHPERFIDSLEVVYTVLVVRVIIFSCLFSLAFQRLLTFLPFILFFFFVLEISNYLDNIICLVSP